MLSGRPAAEADDVWSLCVLLFEMVSGTHPFAGDGDTVDRIAHRIRCRRLTAAARTAAEASDEAAVVAAFATAMLTARRAAPPFASALRGAGRH